MKALNFRTVFAFLFMNLALTSAQAQSADTGAGAYVPTDTLPYRIYEDKSPYYLRDAFSITYPAFELVMSPDDAAKFVAQLKSMPVQTSLRFIGLTNTGTDLRIEIDYKSAALTPFITSGSDLLRARTTAKLMSCDDQAVDFASLTETDNLESTISAFRAFEFKRYMSCTLSVDRIVLSETSNGVRQSPASFHLTVLDSGDIVMKGYAYQQAYQTLYKKPAVASGLDQSTLDAAQTFVRALKNYGNLLLAVRSRPSAERTASLQAYITKNKSSMFASLALIDRNLSSTNILTKFAIISSITQGYSYVHQMESNILHGYMFDETIQQPF